MSRRFIAAVAFGILLPAIAAVAQQQPPAGQKFTMGAIIDRGFKFNQQSLLEAAEKMPEADYSFKPTPQMRPFGQLVSHVALAQFGSCSALKGQEDPHKGDKEEAIKTKSEAVALLKASSELCKDAFSSVNESNLNELVKAGPNEVARGLFVTSTNSHGQEMYGTMAVYLRLKGIVPPTTEHQEEQKKAAEAKKAASSGK
jgi:hypothetical protein